MNSYNDPAILPSAQSSPLVRFVQSAKRAAKRRFLLRRSRLQRPPELTRLRSAKLSRRRSQDSRQDSFGVDVGRNGRMPFSGSGVDFVVDGPSAVGRGLKVRAALTPCPAWSGSGAWAC